MPAGRTRVNGIFLERVRKADALLKTLSCPVRGQVLKRAAQPVHRAATSCLEFLPLLSGLSLLATEGRLHSGLFTSTLRSKV